MSKTPFIIGGVVLVALVAGAVMYKKNSSALEGGEKETRSLFKTQIKKNSNKTAIKEILV
jgi:hypothetical protein